MRIAYVTSYDAKDPLNWSGLGTSIARAIERQGIEVHYVGPLREAWGPWFKAKHAFHKFVLKRSYAREREPRIVRGYARQIRAQIDRQNIDAVVSPGTIPVSLLECPQPIVQWADATFAALIPYYPSCRDLSAGSIRMGLELERQAVHRLAMNVFASKWAADSAIRDYGADPGRVRVIPFGANLEEPPSREEVESMIASRSTDNCNILFIGIDYHRKGGEVATEATRILNELGIPAELQVVGTDPPQPVPPYVKPLGFIKKFTPEGKATMRRLLADAHFLMLPSHAEAYGLAPCEANAFGVPAAVCATGGLTEIVREGLNGFALPPGTTGEAYARRISEIHRDPDGYRALCHRSRQEYEQRLNWDAAGRAFKAILEEVLSRR